jgi:glucose PTS system EIICBA or EIICB component
MEGEIISITEVPDAVFSEKMMGDGFAIKPIDGKVVSPVSGKIINVFPTKHAIGIMSEDSLEVLIHVGIDTVNLKGEGFNVKVSEGETIKAGQTLMEIDLDFISTHATSTTTPVVFTNLPENKRIDVASGPVLAGEENRISIVE